MSSQWRSAVNSRLLFNAPQDASALLRRNADTMSEITNPTDITDIYNRFNEKCIEDTGYSLEYILNAYRNASEIYVSRDFWEGRRATRKKFTLKLFIKRYMPESPLMENIINEISDHDNDDKLISQFFIKDKDFENIDICFIVLLTWEIIRPYTERPHKDMTPDATQLLTFLETLSEKIKGQSGAFEYPIILDDYITIVKNASTSMTIAQVWSVLDEIGSCLQNLSIDETTRAGVTSYIFNLPGIWIDNGDNGESRFWIFPANYKMAFCYELNKGTLILKPYEFTIYSYGDDPQDDKCGLITAAGNEQIIVHSYSCNDQLVYADFSFDGPETIDMITEVLLEPLNRNIGEWFDWTKFIRLQENDQKYHKFSRLLDEHYNVNPMLTIHEVRCDYKWMIDVSSALVAVDKEFLYIKEPIENTRFYLSRKDGDIFNYLSNIATTKHTGLQSLSISENNPMYLIKRNEDQYEHLNGFFARQDEKTRSEYKLFKELASNTKLDDQITIYTITRHGKTFKRLCFNSFSRIFDFDYVIKHYGVEKCVECTFRTADENHFIKKHSGKTDG